LYPPGAAPELPMVAATWVPWPTRSSVSESTSVKFCAAATRPARSGWVLSTPLSTTATLTPVPSKPADQAAGAPICGTLSFRAGLRSPSSQIFAPVPARAVAAPRTPADRLCQTEPSSAFAARRAVPPGTVRVLMIPDPGDAAARAPESVPVRISGRLSRRSS
jgi:hypothetical protein